MKSLLIVPILMNPWCGDSIVHDSFEEVNMDGDLWDDQKPIVNLLLFLHGLEKAYFVQQLNQLHLQCYLAHSATEAIEAIHPDHEGGHQHEPSVVHDSAVHDLDVHDSAVHDSAVHDSAIHDLAVHDLIVHDSAVHDSAVHDSSFHDSAFHDSAIHDSSVYDSAVHN
ncbi:hypothetical protein F2Q68_00004839 [Brassica cretica]|uniref:Uncharacterized protein n=1 Tax=Brassica cretica TaxID=69181 RepID=A0A8S9JNK5_BRACR|nr:hypothetical protein F2Q68_00004839 [Brassica cretica]